MKKITVRVTVPFAVMRSSLPGRAGDGNAIIELSVPARDEAEARRKVEQRVKISVPAEGNVR